MLRHPLAYSPLTLTDEAEVSVKLKLLAGHHLGSGDIVVDLLVHGHPFDETACRWSSSPAAGPHPHWPDGGEQVMLTVRMPQLAVLQVKTIILIFICIPAVQENTTIWSFIYITHPTPRIRR